MCFYRSCLVLLSLTVLWWHELRALTAWCLTDFSFSLSPTPRLRWRKVDGVLPSKVGDTEYGPILTIPDLSFDDEGLYECEAYSSEGRDTQQGRISVQGILLYLRM